MVHLSFESSRRPKYPEAMSLKSFKTYKSFIIGLKPPENDQIGCETCV